MRFVLQPSNTNEVSFYVMNESTSSLHVCSDVLIAERGRIVGGTKHDGIAHDDHISSGLFGRIYGNRKHQSSCRIICHQKTDQGAPKIYCSNQTSIYMNNNKTK